MYNGTFTFCMEVCQAYRKIPMEYSGYIKVDQLIIHRYSDQCRAVYTLE